MRKVHLELSPKAPPLPVLFLLLHLSFSPTTEGKRKWNSLITNPSLWTKKNMHYSRSHWIIASNNTIPTPPSAPLHLPPLHPQVNFEVNSLSLSLFLSFAHSPSLFSSPRMPCRFIWLGTHQPLPFLLLLFLLLLLLTLFSHYNWADVNRECILMIIVSVIAEKIDNLTTEWSFM